MSVKRNTDATLGEDIAPSPANLIASLRDFGYSLPTALADLIDNSVTAQATDIRIEIESGTDEHHIAVVDNGVGMSSRQLVEAMRLSSIGPSESRDRNDLGRFGLGLKTASLSQGRCLTVISKSGGKTTARRWDLTHVRQSGRWQLLKSLTGVGEEYLKSVRKLSHGTAVVIEKLDRVPFVNCAAARKHEVVATVLEELRQHVGMIYHRFIAEDDISISIGRTRVAAWDPFLTEKSTRLPIEQLPVFGSKDKVVVTPYVLPHHSKLTEDEHACASGPNGWNAHQGFYIYRGKRLIVPGSWLRLRLKKEEHAKLARIKVDIPNTCDEHWHLNVMKSHVEAPAYLRDNLHRIASITRKRAVDVYRFRGERVAKQCEDWEPVFLWKRVAERGKTSFRLNRSHPGVQAMLHCGCKHDDLLETFVQVVEDTLPIAAILENREMSLNGAGGDGGMLDPDNVAQLFAHVVAHSVRQGMSPSEAKRIAIDCEPFVRFRHLLSGE